MKMTPFNTWCYEHADEVLMGIAQCKVGGCESCLRRLEIEFHIRAAGAGFTHKSQQKAITAMIQMAVMYYRWMRTNHPSQTAKELIGTIHDLRMKMMGRKKWAKS